MSLYRDLISKGKEAIAALGLPFKVKKEKKNLEMKILELKQQILELKQQIAKDKLTIQEQKSSVPTAWDSLTSAIDNKALNDRKLEQLKNLEQELFAEE